MIEFDVPLTLLTDTGNVVFNDPDDEWFRLIPENCDAGADLRVSADDLPAADGANLHPGFATGYTVKLGLELLKGGGYAVGADRQTMWDELQLALATLRRADGRLQWTTSGGDDRILDNVRCFERAVVQGGLLKTITFTLRSRFPYAITATETDQEFDGGGEMTATNDGTVETYPVFIVDGPADSWTLTNVTTGKLIDYDHTKPGALSLGMGETGHVMMFKNEMNVDGDGANMLPGFVVTSSDFFTLVPGDNDISLVGTTGRVKFNSAWA